MTLTIDIVLIIIVIAIVLIGLIGCIVPVVPGPPISFIGVVVAYFVSYTDISWVTLLILGIIMVIVTVVDFIVPSIATKEIGGTKWGSRGCAIGMLACLFTGQWWAILISPFIGAFVGELLYLYKNEEPIKGNLKHLFKTALGAFLGVMCGIIIKLAYSCFVLFYVAKEFIMGLF